MSQNTDTAKTTFNTGTGRPMFLKLQKNVPK